MGSKELACIVPSQPFGEVALCPIKNHPSQCLCHKLASYR